MSFYYRDNLNEEGKRAYDSVRNGILNYDEVIYYTYSGKGEDIIQYVINDDPLLFHISLKINGAKGDNRYRFAPQYLYNKEQRKEIIVKLENIARNVKNKVYMMNEFDKEKYIHDYINDSVRYDLTFGDNGHTLVGPLLYGRGVCDGYSKAIKFLLDYCGVFCILVVGFALNKTMIPHAWNAVKINGAYYHLDATFNDSMEGTIVTRYDYFNVTDKEICVNHNMPKPLTFRCISKRDNYYVRNKLIFDSEDAISNYICNELRNRRKAILNKEKVVIEFKVIGSGDDVKDILSRLCGNAVKKIFDNRVSFGISYNEGMLVNYLVFNI